MQQIEIEPQYAISDSVITLNVEEIHHPVVKRAFDILFSTLVIIFLLSWIYAILAILIKLESPGPVIFKQKRTGRNNEEFWCYKFRSMKVNAASNHKQACKNDERTTRIGRFLRKSSLDEFPQLVNVLIGDMSIVGPRPHMLKHTEEYKHSINNYMLRHCMKPGITGWAQINGFRGETQTLHLMEKRVQYDMWYVENWSPVLDVKIILLTVSHLVKNNENAY